MSLIELLQKAPDKEVFWEKHGKNLERLGYSKDDIADVEALTDLVIIAKAVGGDVASKKYLDARAAALRGKGRTPK